MANKIRTWTKKDLEFYNIIDTTPRKVKYKDIVDVKCDKCETIGKSTLSNLVSKMITYEVKWRCKECLTKENSERGKVLIGDKNPFYGKNHSDTTRSQLKKSSRKRWDNTDVSVREEIGKRLKQDVKNKYGVDNVMEIEEIRSKSIDSVNEFFKDPIKKANRAEKIKKTTQEKYGVDHTSQNKDIQRKTKDTLIERYGVDHPMKMEETKNKRKATFLKKYGFESISQNPEIALKQAKATNHCFILYHWKDNSEVVCRGSYEKAVVEWLNTNKIDYLWQIHFTLPTGKIYICDLYLVNENKYIEIKGWFRGDAKEKWELFQHMQPNSELWDRNKLRSMGLKIK